MHQFVSVLHIWSCIFFFYIPQISDITLMSSPEFCMMYFACELNKQGHNIEPCYTPFLISNQSVVRSLVLTVASLPIYRFLRRRVRWSVIPISLRISHSLLWSHIVKGFCIVSEAEVDVSFQIPLLAPWSNECNLISGSSVFSKLEHLEVLGSCTAET